MVTAVSASCHENCYWKSLARLWGAWFSSSTNRGISSYSAWSHTACCPRWCISIIRHFLIITKAFFYSSVWSAGFSFTWWFRHNSPLLGCSCHPKWTLERTPATGTGTIEIDLKTAYKNADQFDCLRFFIRKKSLGQVQNRLRCWAVVYSLMLLGSDFRADLEWFILY